jgi:hypothetical protein
MEQTIRAGFHDEIGFFDSAKPPEVISLPLEKAVAMRAAAAALIRGGDLIRTCDERTGIIGDLGWSGSIVWVRAVDGGSEVRAYSSYAGDRRRLARDVLREVQVSERPEQGS